MKNSKSIQGMSLLEIMLTIAVTLVIILFLSCLLFPLGSRAIFVNTRFVIRLKPTHAG